MIRPKLLDLFCGAGGCGMGYHLAGFDVTGVDIVPQPNYPFTFIHGDAMDQDFDGYDVIHASPPCQAWSKASIVHRNNGKAYKDYLSPIREKLKAWGGVWIIENVPGAPIEPYAFQLCGLMFGLKVFRHRLFQTSHVVFTPAHPTHKGRKIGRGYFSIAGGAGRWKSWGGVVHRDISKGTVGEWRNAMGIDWMTRKELTQAIPPAYTEFIGKQLLQSSRGAA